MPNPDPFDPQKWVDKERRRVQQLCEEKPDVVFIGEYSGIMRLNITDTREGSRGIQEDEYRVEDVAITRSDIAKSETALTTIHHALIVGEYLEKDNPSVFQNSESFQHSMAAYNWVESEVPGFDLFPVETVDGRNLEESSTPISGCSG